MAQKRMFDKTITNADDFIEMPTSSQVLYFHLSMNADDDGFVNNWKSIMRMVGAKDDDLKVLIAKQYIIPFDSGVIVIKHWRINNYLRTDRYVETKYKKEKSKLTIDNSMVYQMYTNGIPSIDKNSIDKNSIDKNSIDKNIYSLAEQDTIPYKEIIDYLNFKTKSNYKYSTSKTKKLIKARYNEGFTIEDFKNVIDKKTIEWLNDKNMNQYLRPVTLFGTKFESYLNQPTKKRTLKDMSLKELEEMENETNRVY